MGKISARSMLDVATSAVVIIAASTVILRSTFDAPGGRPPELPVPSKPVSIQDAPIRGSEDAEVLMIVYSDFQCPFCGRFTREVLPDIDRRYISTGKVALVFRHLPLRIHPQAVEAAVAAECAGQQGRFWDMHDSLFALENLDAEALSALPNSIDIDRLRFDECLSNGAIRSRIEESATQASELGIRGTPAFFFGRRLDHERVTVLSALSGVRPADEFVNQLDATLAGDSARPKSWMRILAWD